MQFVGDRRDALFARWRADELTWPAESKFTRQLESALLASDFVNDELTRQGAAFLAALAADDARVGLELPDYARLLKPLLEEERGEPEFMADLRRFRRLHSALIAWWDINEQISLDAALRAVSNLADASIAAAVEFARRGLTEIFGEPRNGNGEAQRMVVLGLGKLGARELNFSSDVDLIFAFPEAGESDGRRRVSCEQFFIRLGQRVIRLLDEITDQGFAYRVDMRLRPHGRAGRLSLSFDAMEHYYQREGRNWERYAWIKARSVAGDLAAGERLIQTLTPFVYRKYLDFTAFEDLRSMKAAINVEIQQHGMERNIKQGRGGIRELEFFVQSFQMVRGGRIAELRTPTLMPTLQRLARLGFIQHQEANRLVSAYRFLRSLENRLQSMADQQTHELPEDNDLQIRIALSLGYARWVDLIEILEKHRIFVHACFLSVFKENRSTVSQTEERWHGLWQTVRRDRDADCDDALWGDGAGASRLLKNFVTDQRLRSLHAKAAARIDRLMPTLLHSCAEQKNPLASLERVVRLLLSISGRSAYLALLEENPAAQRRLVSLLSVSSWVADLLTHHPILLDELLDSRLLSQVPDPELDRKSLDRRLAQISEPDQEQELYALQLFRQSRLLQIAHAELELNIPADQAAKDISGVADVILEASRLLALRDKVQRHGNPGARARLAIVAYGTLGARGLNFSSDLDLVFLFEAAKGAVTDGDRSISNETFFARVVRRIIHTLEARTAAGSLYDVDIRLRPDGGSGLLVSSFDAYADYQRHRAWTWELQALVRGRLITPYSDLQERYAEIRKSVLCAPRDHDSLRVDIREMRGKMAAQSQTVGDGVFHLKESGGGTIDLDFLCQYAVLRWANDHPELVQSTANRGILQTLAEIGLLSDAAAADMIHADGVLRSALHSCALSGEPPMVSEEQVVTAGDTIRAVWRKWLE